MTTVRAASSATPSVALVPRRAAVPQRVAHREVEAREAVLHGAAARVAGAILRENRTVVAVAEAEGDSFLCHKTDKTFKTIVVGISNGSQPLAVASPD